MNGNKYLIIAAIMLGLVLAFGGSTFYMVDPGEQAVEYNRFTGELTTEGKGTHFKWFYPIATVDIYNVQKHKDTADAQAASFDQQPVSTTITVNYHPDPQYIPVLHDTVGTDYLNIIIKPAVQDVTKTCTAKFTYTQLIQAREGARGCIEQNLTNRLAEDHLVVDAISLENFIPPDQVQNTIVEKEAAFQDLQAAEHEKQAAITRAEGEAQATRIVSQTLNNTGPAYVNYLMANQWNGELPYIYAPGGANGDFLSMLMPTNNSQFGNLTE